MTADEKKWMLSVLRHYESLMLENFALQAVLMTHQVPAWKQDVERLVQETTEDAPIRAKFRRTYESLERAPEDADTLQLLRRFLPTSGLVH